MTRKENLLLQAARLENQLSTIKGEAPRHDIDELIKNDRLFLEVRRKGYTLADLEQKIHGIEDSIAKAEKKQKIDAYFATAEGSALKAELKAGIERTEREYQETLNNALASMDAWVKDFLGSDWKVGSLSDRRAELRMTDENGKELFGEGIEVYYYRKSVWDKEDRFEATVGTMGAFPVMGSERARFYTCLGKFLGDTAKLEEYRTMVFELADRLSALCKEGWRLHKRLENPLENEAEG